jgi:hypothetical protein
MAALSPILRSVKWGDYATAVSFWCPGCESAHVVIVERSDGKRPCWGWNGSADAPTFTPSILVTTGKRVDPSYEPEPDFPDPPTCCHTFVTDGKIQFLGDCDHALPGQTVPIPPWPEDFHDGDTSCSD